MIKNVLIVSTRFYPDVGGLERVVHVLAVYLKKMDYNVRVYCTGNLTEQVSIDSVDVFRRKKLFTFSGNDFSPNILSDLWKLLSWADIVIANEPNPISTSFLSLLNAFFKKPLLVIYHSDIVRSGIFSFLKLLYMKTFQALLFHQARRIFTTSKRYQTISDALKPFMQKLDVYTPPIDQDKLKRPCEREIKDFLVAKGWQGKKIILFVGRLIYYKGLDILIDAYSVVCRKEKDSILVLVGTGSLEQQLRDMVRSTGLSDRVFFEGFVEDSLLPFYYSCAYCFVLPSKYRSEAYGLVLVEAMSYGLPCITTDISGTSEVVGSAGLVVPAGESKPLSDAILTLLSDKQLREKLSEQSFSRSKLFYADRVVTEFANKFNTILQN